PGRGAPGEDAARVAARHPGGGPVPGRGTGQGPRRERAAGEGAFGVPPVPHPGLPGVRRDRSGCLVPHRRGRRDRRFPAVERPAGALNHLLVCGERSRSRDSTTVETVWWTKSTERSLSSACSRWAMLAARMCTIASACPLTV